MLGAELIGVLDESSINLNTSPFTVDITDGDLYDYPFFVFVQGDADSSSSLEIIFNSDSGANYNWYVLQGAGGSPSATDATGDSSIILSEFARQDDDLGGFLNGIITGSSGGERRLKAFFSNGSDGSNTVVRLGDYFWTNTVDPIDEITFTGTRNASMRWQIEVYRVPKASDQGWEHMKDLSWSSETAEKSFTVDGDDAGQFRLVWEGDQSLDIELNDDNGSNYVRQYLRNNGGTDQANNTTETSIDTEGINSTIIINAESGVNRLITLSSSDTSAPQQSERAIWWQDTSNITSIDCTPSASSTGTLKLYRKVNTATTSGILPLETIKVIDVSGDFSAGETISGLTCDDYKIIKIEYLAIGNGGTFELQFNADTGTNYHEQRLRANNSSPSASSSSRDSVRGSDSSTTSPTLSEFYIYPKSGEYRPILVRTIRGNESDMEFRAIWWENSADEITSIKAFNGGSGTQTGQIKISVLHDTPFGAATASTLLLNGTSQYLNNSTFTSSAINTNNAISVTGWVYNTGSNCYLVDFGTSTGGNGKAITTAINSNVLQLAVLGASFQGTLSLTASAWHFFAITYDGSEINFRVDASTETIDVTDIAIALPNPCEYVVGARRDTHTSKVTGSMCAVNAFNRVITSDELDELYNGGVAIQPWLLSSDLKADAVLLLPLNSDTDSNEYNDYSSEGNDATATGSPTVTGEDITIISGPDPSP